MFTPQLEEMDLFVIIENQADDINSLIEYIDQQVLDNTDPTPEDEDDDKARTYRIVQIDIYYKANTDAFINDIFSYTKKVFPEYNSAGVPSLNFEIKLPPPKV
jgi:hypothetical protein